MTSGFTGLTSAHQPLAHQIQVAVLGRGVGESVVVHIGDGRWIVVDSFLVTKDDGSRVPAALHYLDSLGVDRESVAAVVVSHFDVDHVRGLRQVLSDSAADAVLVLSGAMSAREFLAQLKLADRRGLGGDAGVEELRELLGILDVPMGMTDRRIERCRRDQYVLRSFESGSFSPTTYGMAPCEDTIMDFASKVAPILQNAAPPILPKPLLNRASAALHLQVGERAVLLCGDLEEDSRAGCDKRGWGGAQLPPNGERVSLVKLGHHGSVNGDHDDIWTRLALTDCLTAAAPYTAQANPLPTTDDVDRVVARGHKMYVAGGKPSPLSPTTGKGLISALAAQGIGVAVRDGNLGAVVATCSADGSDEWDVTTFGSTASYP